MSSVGAALTARVLKYLFWGCAAPHRGSINVRGTINPGLAPWAMQEYRPVGALRQQQQEMNTTYPPQ